MIVYCNTFYKHVKIFRFTVTIDNNLLQCMHFLTLTFVAKLIKKITKSMHTVAIANCNKILLNFRSYQQIPVTIAA